MKSWQMFLVGVVALILLYFLPHYEQTIPGIAAVAIVIAVIVGFLVHPKREVFIVRTNHWNHTPDEASLEHNCLLIKVELARLWLLFIPTFLAVAFLVVAATRGSTWNFPLIDRFWNLRGYMVISIRVLVVVVWWTVSTWVSERWALRGADSACSADSASMDGEYVRYSFRDGHGEYYGGSDMGFGLLRSRELSTIVLYSKRDPQVNKIAVACLFHRLAVVGHGLADLDEETVSAHSAPVFAQQPRG
jgi:hypothetical protein